MNIKPVSDHIVIRGVTKESKSTSGIIIPETANKERAERGEVIAVGDKVEEVVVGQVILFKKYAPDEVKVDGIDYLIVRTDDVIAILE